MIINKNTYDNLGEIGDGCFGWCGGGGQTSSLKLKALVELAR